eukprot:gnl/TRDRNA2_/TRDRNA2_83390_c0_seq1.p1 gnl/TRDRNA2_/TRDRNA2_83390_c0~~gnl/TRDRNA2_/TRDRNA2_83390_c0_seq1.p1  ORF type:complete len:611 (+),score=66.82 gnl/TRDRNA2_/TRDRNA2_83390_c0_seq1:127-1959(+)
MGGSSSTRRPSQSAQKDHSAASDRCSQEVKASWWDSELTRVKKELEAAKAKADEQVKLAGSLKSKLRRERLLCLSLVVLLAAVAPRAWVSAPRRTSATTEVGEVPLTNGSQMVRKGPQVGDRMASSKKREGIESSEPIALVQQRHVKTAAESLGLAPETSAALWQMMLADAGEVSMGKALGLLYSTLLPGISVALVISSVGITLVLLAVCFLIAFFWNSMTETAQALSLGGFVLGSLAAGCSLYVSGLKVDRAMLIPGGLLCLVSATLSPLFTFAAFKTVSPLPRLGLHDRQEKQPFYRHLEYRLESIREMTGLKVMLTITPALFGSVALFAGVYFGPLTIPMHLGLELALWIILLHVRDGEVNGMAVAITYSLCLLALTMFFDSGGTESSFEWALGLPCWQYLFAHSVLWLASAWYLVVPVYFKKTDCIVGEIEDICAYLAIGICWFMVAVHWQRPIAAAYGAASCVVFSFSICFIHTFDYHVGFLAISGVLVAISQIVQEEVVEMVGALEGWCALALGPLGFALFSLVLLCSEEPLLPRSLLLPLGLGLTGSAVPLGRVGMLLLGLVDVIAYLVYLGMSVADKRYFIFLLMGLGCLAVILALAFVGRV